MKTYHLQGVRVERQTERALLFSAISGEFEFWVPRSVVVSVNHDGGTAEIAAWFAAQAIQIKGYERATGHPHQSNANQQSHNREERGAGASAASAERLARAAGIYKRLAFKYHPDRDPASTTVMMDINELWQAVRADAR